MFRPFTANMTHHFKEEDKEFIDQKIAEVKQFAKTVGITLAVAIPSIIVLTGAVIVGSHAAINALDSNDQV